MGDSTFKLAMVQMLVHGGDKARNLCHATEMIAEAASQGADVVLLPETMDLGWTHPSSRQQAAGIPNGDSCAALRIAAAEHHVYVCAGLCERDGDAVYNAAVLIDSQGELCIRHRKLNELAIGFDCYDQGDRLNVHPTPFGTMGVMICADGCASDRVLSRALGYMGADVILSPSAWAVPPNYDNTATPYGDTWRSAYMPVAKEFQMWIAGVSNVGPVQGGPWDGWDCIGCSLLVDAEGKEVLQGPYGAAAETVIYADITPKPRPARGGQWQERRNSKPSQDK